MNVLTAGKDYIGVYDNGFHENVHIYGRYSMEYNTNDSVTRVKVLITGIHCVCY